MLTQIILVTVSTFKIFLHLIFSTVAFLSKLTSQNRIILALDQFQHIFSIFSIVSPDQADEADSADLPAAANDKISEDETSLPQDVNSPQPPLNMNKGEQFLGELSGAQFRNLDQWCYMEHFERDTLIQVLSRIFLKKFIITVELWWQVFNLRKIELAKLESVIITIPFFHSTFSRCWRNRDTNFHIWKCITAEKTTHYC